MRGWWQRRRQAEAEVQRLLDGGSGDTGDYSGDTGDYSGDYSGVAGLLRAAAGPALPGELAGERAAVAVFRQEHAHRGAAAGAPPRRARRSGRRAGVLAAALTVGVLAGTGVAAGAGRLPAPLQRAAHDWIDQVPDHDPQPSPSQTVRAAPGSDPPSVTPGPTGAPSQPATTADADPRKLCKEWEKVRDDPNRKPMDPDDLRVLTAAAGGPDRIEAFCGLTPTGSAPPPPGKKSEKGQPSLKAPANA